MRGWHGAEEKSWKQSATPHPTMEGGQNKNRWHSSSEWLAGGCHMLPGPSPSAIPLSTSCFFRWQPWSSQRQLWQLSLSSCSQMQREYPNNIKLSPYRPCSLGPSNGSNKFDVCTPSHRQSHWPWCSTCEPFVATQPSKTTSLLMLSKLPHSLSLLRCTLAQRIRRLGDNRDKVIGASQWLAPPVCCNSSSTYELSCWKCLVLEL